ncbi:MAG TPA: hypothetical protein VGE76_15385 [Opitutaceae bacterium]
MTSTSIVFRGLVPIVLLAVVGGGLWHLRSEASALRADLDQASKLKTERERLGAELAKQARELPGADELARLRSDREALRRLRAEVESLKAVVAKPPAPHAKTADKRGTFADARLANAAEWKNVGRATPIASFETALWAAASGEVDALAQGLVLEPSARGELEALWAELPPGARGQYGSPERLLAALTLKDIPLGAAQVFNTEVLKPGTHPFEGEISRVVAALLTAENKRTTHALHLQHTGDEWKLVVPQSAVKKYRERLAGRTE